MCIPTTVTGVIEVQVSREEIRQAVQDGLFVDLLSIDGDLVKARISDKPFERIIGMLAPLADVITKLQETHQKSETLEKKS